MNIFDLNKNSLPEQVQINKDDIATLESSKQDVLTFDDVPTQNSDHPVKSDGIYDALAGKQDTLTFDAAPTLNSDHSVTSGGIFTAINNEAIATVAALATKQDTLSFDATPTEDSNNPVKSDGIYDALATKQDTLTTSSVSDGTLDTAIGFDSNGDLVKGTAGGGGGLTLVWSGSQSIGTTEAALGVALSNSKKYLFMFDPSTNDALVGLIIQISSFGLKFTLLATNGGTGSTIYAVQITSGNTIKRLGTNVEIAANGTITTNSYNLILREIYEVQ